MVGLLLAVAAVAGVGWLVVQLTDLYKSLAETSTTLAGVIVGLVTLGIAAAFAMGARLLWKMSRPAPPPAQAPEDIIKAARVQLEKTEGTIELVDDGPAKSRLRSRLAELRREIGDNAFHVVVFGTGSAGKTSLIAELLGHEAGAVDAVMGTTRAGANFEHPIAGIDGRVLLTDTPGLSEIGREGALREAEARDLAARADLLVFVLENDLIRSEFEPLAALAKQGKRSLVALNKKDRYEEADLAAILDKLRARLHGLVASEDVFAVAAAPRPMSVRVMKPDGGYTMSEEPVPADVAPLRRVLASVLKREWDELRARNFLLKAHLLSREAQDEVGRERDDRARAIVEKFQWITAGTVFANPLPALDVVAAGAIQFQMISEVAAVYGVELSMAHARKIGEQMIKSLLKFGFVEAATSTVAGMFKASLVGFATGGAIQAVSMAYLTHIAGLAFREYFKAGQNWGDGGMQAALNRQFSLHSRGEFLQEFARQALDRFRGRGHNTDVQPIERSAAR